MRQLLHHYFQPTEEDTNEVWKTGVFSFDASVLLNIYAYSDETRDELVKLITSRAAQSLLPHQFALEFARNRATVIVRQVKHYEKAEEDLRKIEQYLARKIEHPHISIDSLNSLKTIVEELANRRKEVERLIGNDPFATTLLEVFKGRVTPEPTTPELVQLHTDAATRYSSNIPPGFADQKAKGVPDAYGDYIGWRQLMSSAQLNKKMLFWLLMMGRMIGGTMKGVGVSARFQHCEKSFSEKRGSASTFTHQPDSSQRIEDRRHFRERD